MTIGLFNGCGSNEWSDGELRESNGGNGGLLGKQIRIAEQREQDHRIGVKDAHPLAGRDHKDGSISRLCAFSGLPDRDEASGATDRAESPGSSDWPHRRVSIVNADLLAHQVPSKWHFRSDSSVADRTPHDPIDSWCYTLRISSAETRPSFASGRLAAGIPNHS